MKPTHILVAEDDKNILTGLVDTLESEGYQVTGTKKDLSAMANYLSKVLEVVEKDLKAGKSKEEILKYTSIPGAEDWTGRGIETSLNSAIEELSKK